MFNFDADFRIGFLTLAQTNFHTLEKMIYEYEEKGVASVHHLVMHASFKLQ